MSRLSGIPIKVLPPPGQASGQAEPQGLGRGSNAILMELADLLERLAKQNVTGAIDLHSLPMSDLDRKRLQDDLGQGEVHAILNLEGISEIQETSIPGIWWIQHHNHTGKLIAELIEVAAVPSILSRVADEFATGVELLRERIAAGVAVADATSSHG